MLYYVMLCYVMLWYVMLCYVCCVVPPLVLPQPPSCCLMLCYAKKFVYLKLGFEWRKKVWVPNWVSESSKVKTANFQTQFSLLKIDHFLITFASKIAFGLGAWKKKGQSISRHTTRPPDQRFTILFPWTDHQTSDSQLADLVSSPMGRNSKNPYWRSQFLGNKFLSESSPWAELLTLSFN